MAKFFMGNKVLALKALKKSSLQREITETNQELNLPFFELKRRFRQMIQSGRGIFMRIYNLYKLGDMDEKLLIPFISAIIVAN